MNTGDVIVARRFTGHTTEMMLVSGGLANHAAMIYRDPDSSAVFVLDSFHEAWGADGLPGVKKTLVNEWLQIAEDGGFEVAYLPLDPARAKTPDKLWTWFESVEGSAYDYALELFAAVDDASSGFPAPFNAEILPVLLRLNQKWRFGDELLTKNLIKGLN